MRLPYNRHFPTLKYLAMNSCAINISDRSIKYGELVATPEGIRLGKYGHFKIPSGIVVSGKIEKRDELIKILNDLRIKEKLNFIRVTLPEEQTYLFNISIRKTENQDLREIISLQIEEHVPLSAEEITFDFNVLKILDDSTLVEVVAMATNTVLEYTSVFEKALLTPLSFEVESQAIARSVIPYGDDSPMMIVDFGNNRTGVSVASDGRVFMATTLDVGGYNLTNMISKNFSMSFEDAENLKGSYGLRENNNVDDIFPVILNGISVLRDELNKQSMYWKNSTNIYMPKKEIKHIVLCGGDSNLSGLASYLSASMYMKVSNANTWVNISSLKNSVPSISFEDSLSYATVLGLALADFSYDKPILNLLPQDKKKINKNNYWERFCYILFMVISLASIIATMLLFPIYFFSKEKEFLTEKRLEDFNKENPELSTKNMDETISDVNSKLSIISKNKSTEVVEQIIYDILRDKPEGIDYEQILYNKRSDGISVLEIHGIASNRSVLRNVKTIFENNPKFTLVDLPISSFIESSNINFKINMNIK